VNLKEAREINGNVARWYLETTVFGEEATLPPYPKDQMLEAFRLVQRANEMRPVRDDGSVTVHSVCDDRIADMVVDRRGW